MNQPPQYRPRDELSPEVRRLLKEPRDADVLEAALLRTVEGGCSREELLWALNWLPDRLERAVASLEAQLEERTLMLVCRGEELYIDTRPGFLNLGALERLAECVAMRTAPTSAQAARIADLITERLTEPEPTAATDIDGACDRDLLKCGVLKGRPNHDGPDGWRTRVSVYPDVYFALGLTDLPYPEDVPERPARPRPE